MKPDEIYIQLFSLEQEIKRKSPDFYFRIKDFAHKAELRLTYAYFSNFKESMAKELWKSEILNPNWYVKGEEQFEEVIEDLLFEILYSKLLFLEDNEEERNVILQQKLFIMQNIVSPDMLKIKPEHFANNVYQLAFAELKKINNVKCPKNKCEVIYQTINCISGNFFLNSSFQKFDANC